MLKIKRLFQSFKYALRGLLTVFKTEQSFRIQCIAAVVTILVAWFFQIRRSEWIIILLLVGSVLSLEVMNSILERLVDTFKPRIHPMVKEVKDMMASAVLIVSLVALIIGVIIFYPYVYKFVV